MRIVVLVLALSACASMEPDPAVPEDACGASRLAGLIGRDRREVLEDIGRIGAPQIRFIIPGDVVTMDYRADRLNVHLDARDRIIRFACG